MAEDSASQDSALAGAAMLENRLRKNLRRLAPWLRRTGIDCYRAYDTDLPEYAAAIDVYTATDGAVWLHVQEYRAPKEIPVATAEQRLLQIVTTAQRVFAVPDERVALKTRERGKGGSKYGRFAGRAERIHVREGAAQLYVNLFDYLDTGLFLDHRPMRRRLAAAADGKRVLNLFCYTGAATVQAIVGGAAATVSVDLSNTYLDWAEDNLLLNNADPATNRLLRADVREWLAASTEVFDLIFCDPPTFSNSKRASDFDVQRDHAELLTMALRRLAIDGELYFSTNARRFRLDQAALAPLATIDDLTSRSFDPDFARDPKLHYVWRLRHPARGDKPSW